MPAIQTVYNDDIAFGYAGAIGRGSGVHSDISLDLEGVTACAFGRAVYRGSTDRGAVLTPAVGALRGFAQRVQGLAETSTRPLDSYAPNDTMAVREKGPIYTTSATAAADGEQVYVTPAGLVSNSAAGNTIADGWKFDQTIAAAGVVLIVNV